MSSSASSWGEYPGADAVAVQLQRSVMLPIEQSLAEAAAYKVGFGRRLASALGNSKNNKEIKNTAVKVAS